MPQKKQLLVKDHDRCDFPSGGIVVGVDYLRLKTSAPLRYRSSGDGRRSSSCCLERRYLIEMGLALRGYKPYMSHTAKMQSVLIF